MQVQLTVDAGHAILTIADDGPGVSQDQLPRLFQRFSRGDASRSSAGHGLGLALVAAIAAAHHGSVHAESQDGLRIAVLIPTRSGFNPA